MTRNTVAASVRRAKAEHPELYCPARERDTLASLGMCEDDFR